jgi:hypothetical protein
MTNPLLIKKCRILRKRNFTLPEIVKLTRLPKTTVYDNICDIALSSEKQREIQEAAVKRLAKFSEEKKGKCIAGRVVPKPEGWPSGLIFLVAHFMFDGEICSHRCVYSNRNTELIDRVEYYMNQIFDLESHKLFYKETGVHRISYFYIELADYIKKRAHELIEKYIKVASLSEKRIFLRAFFDDEGCAYRWGNARKVRGFQQDLRILELIQKLLKDFDIESKIDKKYKEIVISRKENLIKFRDKINFSKGVYINPDRKNSIWKQKLEKREILNRAINSYIK